MERGSGRFTDDDWVALQEFLKAQEGGNAGIERGRDLPGVVDQRPLSPEQLARIRISDSYIAQYFQSFIIKSDLDFVPHAQRMLITLPIWKAVIPVDIVYPDQSVITKPLKEAYPDFGIADIHFAAMYMSAYYLDQKDSLLIGTDQHRRADQISTYWRAIEGMAEVAMDMDPAGKM